MRAMVIICAAPGCLRKKDSVTTRGSSVQFHRFPLRKPDILAKWVKAMKIKNFKPNVNSYLCNAHFKESDYDLKPTNAGKHLKPNAIPSISGKKKLRKPRKVKLKKHLESDSDSKGEVEQLESGNDNEISYFEIETLKTPENGTDSQLAGILENESKGSGTLQVLIVGEDGKITNSEYFLKKEVHSDEDKNDFENNNHSCKNENDEEFVLMKTDRNGEVENSVHYGIKSEPLTDLWYRNDDSKLQIAKLEEKLMKSRRKVKVTEMKCMRLKKKVSELKTLLKLLVFKRGKGEKNLSELLEEYGNEINYKIKREKEENCNSSQSNQA